MLQRTMIVLAGLVLAAPAYADDATGITVSGLAVERTLTPDDMAGLPVIQVPVAFGTEHGARQAMFEGPLLWTVLEHEGAIDPAKPREQVRLAVLVQGHDGYAATLALGEISPAFEGKQVILADKQDGQALPSGHYRLVVPGDRMGGRSVRDVARLSVVPLPSPP